jgi:hypothetical protein
MESYLLMDLERSVLSGVVHYWKGNKHGYTADPKEAGVFIAEKAKEICAADIDKKTILIPAAAVYKLLERL